MLFLLCLARKRDSHENDLSIIISMVELDTIKNIFFLVSFLQSFIGCTNLQRYPSIITHQSIFYEKLSFLN